MKELSTHLKDDIKGKMVAQVPKQTEYALMGVIKPKPGQIVFEFNLKTGECREAQYKIQSVMFSKLRALKPIRELIIQEGCIYIPALNKTNAEAKYAKSKVQSDYYQKQAPASIDQHFI